VRKTSRPCSEEDFKTIAQAAVSNLILNAGSNHSDSGSVESKSEGFDGPIDTSTAHIKALTGNNWVAACSGAAIGVTPVSAVCDSKANNRAKRQNLTPDERARQNRDRNREHARNTRLRKKAYVEELKRTLTELVSQRDTAEFEKRQSAQRELEQREVRFRVIEEFLKLKGRHETNFSRWAAILEDGFSLTAPCIDLRKVEDGTMSPGQEQVLNGVSTVMTDSATFNTFLQTLGNGEGQVTFQYQCDRKNFFMDSCNAAMEWSGMRTATSIAAVACFKPF
jgi:flagellar biosynthesis GTPase FlhF